MAEQHPFKWRHFQADIILLYMRWYHDIRSAISTSKKSCWSVDCTSIIPRSIAGCSAPQLDKRCQPHLKACNDSWKVDETSIKIRKTCPKARPRSKPPESFPRVSN